MKRAEQRVRAGRARLELRVRLGGRRRTGATSRGSSTNSTSRPSGDVPEITRPAASSCVAVGVVDLVAVPVPLGHRRSSRRPRRPASRSSATPGTRRAASCRPGRRSPATIVDLVGHRRDHRMRWCLGSNSAEFASSMPARWRAASITMHCRPRHRPSVGMPLLAGVPERADLALDAADAEPARDHDAVDAGERLRPLRPGSRTRRRRPSGSSPALRWANPPARSASVTDR